MAWTTILLLVTFFTALLSGIIIGFFCGLEVGGFPAYHSFKGVRIVRSNRWK